MSHYVKDLSTPCPCANYMDAMWFLGNPDRVRYLRCPYECEIARIDDDQLGLVSQVICVQVDRTLNQLAKEHSNKRGIMEVKTRRRSFLFLGRHDFSKTNSDDAVSQFLAFIDDGGVHMINVSVH